MIQQNVIAMSGRAVEAAGDVNTLLLDKTGTITLGNRQASEFLPVAGVAPELLADRAQLASLADETPEGRSIVVLAKTKFGLRGRDVGGEQAHPRDDVHSVQRDDAHERRERGRLRSPQGRRRRRAAVGQAAGRSDTARHRDDDSARRDGGRHAARRRREARRQRPLGARAGRRLPQGHREGRHPRAVRPLARDGHSHGDDHGRQSAHRGRDRAGGGRRRLPRRGEAGRQDGADQARAAGRQARRDDRRRHERRARARAGGRRRGDEHAARRRRRKPAT